MTLLFCRGARRVSARPIRRPESSRARERVATTPRHSHSHPPGTCTQYLAALAAVLPPDAVVINTSKGLHTQRLEMMTELIPAALGRASQPVVVLSGPTFAEEIMQGV